MPALWALWEIGDDPPYLEKPIDLRTYGIPSSILKLAAPQTGFVNFYRAYRNSSYNWITSHFESIAPLIHKSASLKSDHEARELAEAIDELPKIPKPKRRLGRVPAANLLTPLLGCLDPRLRFPLVNKADHVVRLHRKLGITSFSLPDKFNTLVRLIGQYGIRDALMLDVVSNRLVRKALPKVQDSNIGFEKNPDRALDQKDDDDITVIVRNRSRKAVRLHNSMTNQLTRLCKRAHHVILEGVEPFRYDALVKNYDHQGRDLLIEAKSSSHRSQLRLAVGQLLDYRRALPRRAATDLAVLLPNKPSRDSLSFLADVGIHALWFSNNTLRSVEGDLHFL
ncbi:MAG: hypothetical protein QME52_09940 [Bacteroidota bacterium]|nr:hypothetical protein [Bacteroidota bacterium]